MVDVAYVALGSNLGDRGGYLARARSALASLPRTRLVGQSAVEETDAFGPVPQGPYLNQMVALETALTPHQLLEYLRHIEEREGRRREQRWGPRTLDLDIVCFESQTVSDDELVVPHPGLADREFWARELAELRGRCAGR